MGRNEKKLAFITVWTICAQGGTYSQNATDYLQRLVDVAIPNPFSVSMGILLSGN
jgi:hypothetical protein